MDIPPQTHQLYLRIYFFLLFAGVRAIPQPTNHRFRHFLTRGCMPRRGPPSFCTRSVRLAALVCVKVQLAEMQPSRSKVANGKKGRLFYQRTEGVGTGAARDEIIDQSVDIVMNLSSLSNSGSCGIQTHVPCGSFSQTFEPTNLD